MTTNKKTAPAAKKSPILDPDSVEDVTEFDVDAWIDDAKVPTRSMVVYKRADLYADLEDIERQISMATEDSGANDAGVNALKAQWEELARKIEASAVTIVVRAMTDDAAKQARADAKEEGVKAKAAAEWDAEGYDDEVTEAAQDEAAIDNLNDEETEALVRKRKIQSRRTFIDARFDEAVGEHLLVRLLVRPKMTLAQVRALGEQIGTTQRDRLASLMKEASGEVRVPTAPFSRSSSQGRRGVTSSSQSARRGRGGSRR